MTARHPDAEVAIDEALVRALLTEQHPDLSTPALQCVGVGWDNETWRLGDDLAVRLPRRELGVALLRTEQSWLKALAPSLPLPLPVPVRTGVAGGGYPWPWSIVPWFPGTTADDRPIGPAGARRLARLLHALHVPAPPQAPHNPFRSVPLSARPSPLAGLQRLFDGAPPAALGRVWARGLAAPVPSQRRWVHGDLHARNLVVDDGELRAVIDWGDLAGGDPAVDLSVLWTVLDPSEHSAFCEEYGPVEGDVHARARGWALAFAVIFAELREDPVAVRIGQRALGHLCR
jgi:aminoglycoside phosphotransferase (APT) family kinase protein